MADRPKPTTQEIGRKILRNLLRNYGLAVDPVVASDLVQEIAETIAMVSTDRVGSPGDRS